jgi:hypothetical protein
MPCAAMAHPTKYVEEQELQEAAEFSNTLSLLDYIMLGQEKTLARLRWPKRL